MKVERVDPRGIQTVPIDSLKRGELFEWEGILCVRIENVDSMPKYVTLKNGLCFDVGTGTCRLVEHNPLEYWHKKLEVE